MPVIDYADVVNKLRGLFDAGGPPHHILDSLVRNACATRAFLLTQEYVERHGDTVYAGPFKGMRLADVMPPFLISRYIGAYEHELAPVVEEVVRTPYDTILNIGCAEGYYAVGLARRMPGVRVHAFDILASAREKCGRLALFNGVADRLVIGERFEAADFARYAGRRALVFCDIEGAEFELLDPEAQPALRDMDLVVEIHEGGPSRNAEAFRSRFAATHHVTAIGPARGYEGDLPPWLLTLSELDVHLASTSFRSTPTPWVHLRSRFVG
jgi:hypothetical protein